jgi:hypothetical protein
LPTRVRVVFDFLAASFAEEPSLCLFTWLIVGLPDIKSV